MHDKHDKAFVQGERLLHPLHTLY